MTLDPHKHTIRAEAFVYHGHTTRFVPAAPHHKTWHELKGDIVDSDYGTSQEERSYSSLGFRWMVDGEEVYSRKVSDNYDELKVSLDGANQKIRDIANNKTRRCSVMIDDSTAVSKTSCHPIPPSVNDKTQFDPSSLLKAAQPNQADVAAQNPEESGRMDKPGESRINASPDGPNTGANAPK